MVGSLIKKDAGPTSFGLSEVKIDDASDYVGSWKSDDGGVLILRENGEFFLSNTKTGVNFSGKWHLLDDGTIEISKGRASIDKTTGEISLGNTHFKRDLI